MNPSLQTLAKWLNYAHFGAVWSLNTTGKVKQSRGLCEGAMTLTYECVHTHSFMYGPCSLRMVCVWDRRDYNDDVQQR
jgi:hypothetical protein